MTLALPTPAAAGARPRRDARWRLAAFLVFAGGCALVRTPAGAGPLAAAALAAALAARVPAADILGRAGLLAASAAPLLIVGPVTSGAGVTPAIALLLRVVAAGVAGLALARAAPLADTLAAAQALGAPARLVAVARLADRHGRLLFGEARRVRVALRVRGFRVTTSRHTAATLGYAVAGLLVRADGRTDRVAAAMQARGFTGAVPAAAEWQTTAGDVTLLLVSVMLIATAVVADRAVSSP